MLHYSLDIKTVFIYYAAFRQTYCNHFISFFIQDAGGVFSHVPESLYCDADLEFIHIHPFHRFFEYIDPAKGSCITPCFAPAQFNRFPCYYCKYMFSFYPLIFIEYPDHDLFISINIRSGNIDKWPDVVRYVTYIASCDLLKLIPAQSFWIQTLSSFWPPEGYIHHCAFERHQKREVCYMVKGQIRVEPDASFSRAASIVILHPESHEHFDFPRVHSHRKMYYKRTPWHIQQIEFFPGQAKF